MDWRLSDFQSIASPFELNGEPLSPSLGYSKNPRHASPEYVPGEWCGITYKAYLDFVSGRSDLEFKTVNTDYGCGVIRKAALGSKWRGLYQRVLRNPAQYRRAEELIERWRTLDRDYASTFCFFQKHAKELLNLISLDDFIEQNRRGHWRQSRYSDQSVGTS